MKISKLRYLFIAAAIIATWVTGASPGITMEPDSPRVRLLAAYPQYVKSIDGNEVVWMDGSKTQFDDGKGTKNFETWLASPDLEDMFQVPYVAGEQKSPPTKDSDPGRARNEAFFNKMYGDCQKGETAKQLVDVIWLPKKSGAKIKFAKANGAAAALEAVSKELDQLPPSFDKYLVPTDGTFVCRVIAGTNRVSAHGHGIAIDISTKHAHYWRWAKGGPDGPIQYKNEIPMEIVSVFEKHGFIWGGKWHHYDTMHFEFRPELMPPVAAARLDIPAANAP